MTHEPNTDGLLDTARAIADALGRAKIAAAVQVGTSAVSNHVTRSGRFPSDWWLPVKTLADQRGVRISEAAFSFLPRPEESAPETVAAE